MWWLLWPAAAAALLLLAGALLGRLLPRRHTALAGRHVLVTGGSSGIGRSLAALCAKQGAHVTLVARDQERLEQTKREIQAATEGARVLCLSLDVAKDAAAVREAVLGAEQELGPLYFVACCAGFALAQRCEEMPIATHRRLMEVNYFGVLNVLHAAVSGLKARREGRIAVVSSLGGVVGLWGFTGYCASKYALVGLSHTLLQELKPYGVGVTLCYPPDTDTPGFEQENRTKPEETRLICETAGLFPAEKVAEKLLDDVMAGNINSTVGTEGLLMTTVGLGMGPVGSVGQLAREVLLMPIFRLVVAFFHRSWDGIVRDCMRKRDESKKSE